MASFDLDVSKAVFSQQYGERPSWGHGSGPGSDVLTTTAYRAFVDQFIGMNGIRTVVDIGCGDWRFSRFINYEGVDYLGYDVVPQVIAQNQERFGRPGGGRRFSLMPPSLDALEPADLLIIKDVLQHVPDQQILDFKNIAFPKYKYVLVTNSFRKHGTEVNIDIEVGGFRCLDVASAPYSFQGAWVLEFDSPLWERIRSFLIVNR